VRALFFDREDETDPQNGIEIECTEQLTGILESARSRTPFFAELVGENGFSLILGIGGLGCAQYSPSDGDTPYLMAVDPTTRGAEGHMEFLARGTLTSVSMRYALSIERIREIAIQFLTDGTTSHNVTWEKL
jgi:hypothetical protein